MSYTITKFPYDPVIIDGLTILSISEMQTYWEYLQGLQSIESESVVISVDGKIVKKQYKYFGDLGNINDVSAVYKKEAINQMFVHMDDESRQQLFDIDRTQKTILWKIISESDLPLTFDDSWNVENLLKLHSISVLPLELSSGYDKIDSIINIASELEDSSLLVFTNVHLYLSMEQIDYLFLDIKQKKLSVLFLEMTPTKLKVTSQFEDHQHFIDDDFVQF